MNVNGQIVSLVRSITDKKLKIQKDCIKKGNLPPKYDLRDFTDNNLIYGLKMIPILRCKTDTNYDGDFNLGSCLSLDTAIPSYKFFRFKDIYKVVCEVYDQCGFERFDFRKIPIKNALSDIFEVLTNNDKYWRTLAGKYCYRICIFIYGGYQYTNDLDKLASKFRERDIEEAKAISIYFNSRLIQSLNRIEKFFVK